MSHDQFKQAETEQQVDQELLLISLPTIIKEVYQIDHTYCCEHLGPIEEYTQAVMKDVSKLTQLQSLQSELLKRKTQEKADLVSQ